MEPTVFTIDYIFHLCALVQWQLCRLQGKQQSYTIDWLTVISPLAKWPRRTPPNHLSEWPTFYLSVICALLNFSRLGTQSHFNSHCQAFTLIKTSPPFFFILIIESCKSGYGCAHVIMHIHTNIQMFSPHTNCSSVFYRPALCLLRTAGRWHHF